MDRAEYLLGLFFTLVLLGCLFVEEALLAAPVVLLYILLSQLGGHGWETPAQRMRRASSLMILTVLLVVGSFFGATLVLFSLLTGWVPFFARTVPRVRFDAASVALGIGCLGLLIAGLQVFGKKVWSRPPTDDHPGRVWKLRWTFAILAVVVLLFGSGLAAVGMMQTGMSVWELRRLP